ncbi:hypothetical protein [Bradyrhizobium sp. HKCCYLR1023]|uniref:hypothetical protein n=1 Tax=Bradyrhizobium TaxID=374 RepID=UPI003EBFACEB
MSFVEIEKRDSGLKDAGVRIAFRARKSDGKLVCRVGLRASFLASSGFGEASAYRLGVGRDEDAGKIALWPDASGPFTARKAHNARCIDLGHVATLRAAPCKAHAARVEMRDGRAIITLPAMDAAESAGGHARGEDEPGETFSPLPSAPAQTAPARTPPRKESSGSAASRTPEPVKAPAAAQMVEFPEVTINLAEGNETVTRNGESLSVSPRGARLVAALARVMPNCVGDDFLIQRLWDKKPAGGAASLEMVIADLKGLSKLGLEIRNQRGIGRQLVVR